MRGLVHIKEVRPKEKKDIFCLFSYTLTGTKVLIFFVSRPQELNPGVQAEEEQTFHEISTVDKLTYTFLLLNKE